MLELNQLRCFVAVASELNFRRAAERLNMTQPPLSRQIQLLEHRLGVVLFERSKRSVRLTAAGRALFSEAQRLLDQVRATTLSVQRIAGGDSGSLAISFVPSAGFELLPSLVARLQAAHPRIDITLKEAIGAAGGGVVNANRKKFRGTLERAEAGGWQIVWSDEPPRKPGQKVSKKREPAPLQAMGFTLDELREARLAPVVNFKGRGAKPA